MTITVPAVVVSGQTISSSTWGNVVRQALLDLDTKIETFRPAGEITMYPGTSAPAGWAICDGSTYATASYPGVAAALGAVGPTFAVPDMRGRTPMGYSAGTYAGTLRGTGGSANAVVVSHAHTAVAADTNHYHGVANIGTSYDGDHNHRIDPSGQDFVTVYGGPAGFSLLAGSQTVTTHGAFWSGDNGGHSHTVTGRTDSLTETHAPWATHTHTISTEGSSATNANLQPFYVINYIIRMF